METLTDEDIERIYKIAREIAREEIANYIANTFGIEESD